MNKRKGLYDFRYKELEDLLASWGEPRYRASQVWNWLYRSLVGSVDEMANLPPTLRERLAADIDQDVLTPVAEQESATGETRKTLFRLRDGNTIESVLMSYYDRQTACISTQVGCGMGCVFCATGQGGLARNLSPGEIVAQVTYLARELRSEAIAQAQREGIQADLAVHPVTNIVFMGMGEPLANYAATWQAIETLSDERGYNLGARHMTVSTVGLVPGIRRLAEEGLAINLAISLHAPDDELRDRLVPVNHRYPLAELMGAVRDYVGSTHRRVTIEYALIAGINDSVEQAHALAGLLGDLLCHVNLIPLNPTPGSPMQPSAHEQVEVFRSTLELAGIPATVRIRRGIDIEAGCGQLRRRYREEDIAAG